MPVDPGRHLTKPGPGIGDDEHRHAALPCGLPAGRVGEHGDRPGRHRVLAELGTVVLAAGQCRVQVAGADPARVVGYTADQQRATGPGEGIGAGPGHDDPEQRGKAGQGPPLRAEGTQIRRHAQRLSLFTLR